MLARVILDSVNSFREILTLFSFFRWLKLKSNLIRLRLDCAYIRTYGDVGDIKYPKYFKYFTYFTYLIYLKKIYISAEKELEQKVKERE